MFSRGEKSGVASSSSAALLACEVFTSERVLTRSVSTNKRLLDEVASVPSKRLRNKISGCESGLSLLYREPSPLRLF